MRHCTKCCADRSNRCPVIVILDFLRLRPPPSWIYEITIFTVRRINSVKLLVKFRDDR